MAATAEMTRAARGVVMHEHAVAFARPHDAGTDRLDDADRFVAQHARHLAPDVPRQRVAAADAAGAYAHDRFAGAGHGVGPLFDADVVDVVGDCSSHGITTAFSTVLSAIA